MQATDMRSLLKDCPLARKGQLLLRIYYYQKSRQADLNAHKLQYHEQGYADVWQARYDETQTLIEEAEAAFCEDYLLMLFSLLP